MPNSRRSVLAGAMMVAFGTTLILPHLRADADADMAGSRSGASRRAAGAPQYPAQRYGVSMAYYSVRGDLQSRLTLNNKGPNDLPAQVTLYARNGRRFSSDEILIEGRTFADVDLRDVVAAAGEGFEDGSLRVTYTGRLMELGSLLTMTNEENGTEWHDLLMYGTGARSNRLEGVWWLPNEATEARLVVTNTTRDDVDVTVTFDGTPPARTETFHLGPWELQVLDFGKPDTPGQGPRDGRLGGISISYTGEPGGVVARGFVLNAQSGYSAVVPLADPAGARTTSYHAGGVRLLPIDGVDVEPVIVARNVGAAPVTVTGRLQVTGPSDEITAVELAPVAIGPGETTPIDGRPAWVWAASLTAGEPAGLELEHDGAPGSVVLSAATVSRDLDHVFHVPLTDPETLPSSTGGYFWRLEGSRNTLVLLKNMTDEPQRYTLSVRHAEGSWAAGLQTLAPHESRVLDLAALRANQVPDATGRTIPLTVTSGQVHWSIGGGRNARGIVGRIEQVDYALGVSATYACPQPTNDIFASSWMDPGYALIEVDDTRAFDVWESDEDAWGEPTDTYLITDILDWSTGNTSIADIAGFSGLVEGIGHGSTAVYAEGESNGWIDEFQSDHEWVSELANVDVQWAVPTAETTAFTGWHSTGPTWANFTQTLFGGNFDGRWVREEDGGNGDDTCHFPESEKDEWDVLTEFIGHPNPWLVDENNKWGPDTFGWATEFIIYYRGEGMAPCQAQFNQKMYIQRPGTGDYHYVTQVMKTGFTDTTVWSERAGVHSGFKPWQ